MTVFLVIVFIIETIILPADADVIGIDDALGTGTTSTDNLLLLQVNYPYVRLLIFFLHSCVLLLFDDYLAAILDIHTLLSRQVVNAASVERVSCASAALVGRSANDFGSLSVSEVHHEGAG